jgi:cysteine sulfinate desulfinase/cysteine desulfurase-like protein
VIYLDHNATTPVAPEVLAGPRALAAVRLSLGYDSTAEEIDAAVAALRAAAAQRWTSAAAQDGLKRRALPLAR